MQRPELADADAGAGGQHEGQLAVPLGVGVALRAVLPQYVLLCEAADGAVSGDVELNAPAGQGAFFTVMSVHAEWDSMSSAEWNVTCWLIKKTANPSDPSDSNATGCVSMSA